MVEDSLRNRAIALFDDFTHNKVDRRDFMANMVRLAGSTAAANALIAAIANNPAAASIIDPADPRLKIETVNWPGHQGRTLSGYWASPAEHADHKLPAIMVIHENRGLTDHIKDVARRLALAGYHTLAPDFLSPAGGTPQDADKARDMIGALVMADTIEDAAATVRWLKTHARSTGKVGVTGFCWGGALSNWTAVAAGSDLAAAIPYYGPAPGPEQAAKVSAPLLLQYAGIDDRVNQTAQPWIDALKAAGKSVEAHFYADVYHAFNNDTSAERYNKAAADLAWSRTLAFFKMHLSG